MSRILPSLFCFFLFCVASLSAQIPAVVAAPADQAAFFTYESVVETPFFAKVNVPSVRGLDDVAVTVRFNDTWFATETLFFEGRSGVLTLPLFNSRPDLVNHLLDVLEFEDVTATAVLSINGQTQVEYNLVELLENAPRGLSKIPSDLDRDVQVSESMLAAFDLIERSGGDYKTLDLAAVQAMIPGPKLGFDDAANHKISNTSCYNTCIKSGNSCRLGAQSIIEEMACDARQQTCIESCGLLPPTANPTSASTDFYIVTGERNRTFRFYRFRYTDRRIVNFTEVGSTSAYITDLAQSPSTRAIYAISTEGVLYRLNNGSLVKIGNTGKNDSVALDFCGSNLYGWTSTGDVFTIDPGTARVTNSWTSRYKGSGDLMCSLYGILYGVAQNNSQYLVKHYLVRENTSLIGQMSTSPVWAGAIDQADNIFAAQTREDDMLFYVVNPKTGAMTLLTRYQLPGTDRIHGMTSAVIAY